jgi:hypothetical protein
VGDWRLLHASLRYWLVGAEMDLKLYILWSAFSCSGGTAARQREIRLPAKAKACDVCANATFRISTLHRRCLHDVI